MFDVKTCETSIHSCASRDKVHQQNSEYVHIRDSLSRSNTRHMHIYITPIFSPTHSDWLSHAHVHLDNGWSASEGVIQGFPVWEDAVVKLSNALRVDMGPDDLPNEQVRACASCDDDVCMCDYMLYMYTYKDKSKRTHIHLTASELHPNSANMYAALQAEGPRPLTHIYISQDTPAHTWNSRSWAVIPLKRAAPPHACRKITKCLKYALIW